MIVFDSINHRAKTDELVSSYKPWQDLATESSISTTTDSKTLAVAAMQLLFDAIAGKWSEYILRMHGFVSALAEDIYDEPANDEPSSMLWSVSKELLQAERLLKAHIRLLETIQSELTNTTGSDALKADWLPQDLEEFRRLGGEVEETLQKPIAHMLDLVRSTLPKLDYTRAHNHCLKMYKSISISDSTVNERRKEPGFLTLLMYCSLLVDEWAMPGSFSSNMLDD